MSNVPNALEVYFEDNVPIPPVHPNFSRKGKGQRSPFVRALLELSRRPINSSMRLNLTNRTKNAQAVASGLGLKGVFTVRVTKPTADSEGFIRIWKIAEPKEPV